MQTFEIHNRRYLGSKTRLLELIEYVVRTECKNMSTFADLFAGTGVVCNTFFKSNKLIVNDILLSNYHSYVSWFDKRRVSRKKLNQIIEKVNQAKSIRSNYFSKNFAGTYFSKGDCLRIGFFRDMIEDLFTSKEINSREKSILITSIIYSADRAANTCGHYDAYRMTKNKRDNIIFKLPNYNTSTTVHAKIFREDANNLAKKIKSDVVYIDPPYNSRQYSDTYHLLENIASWKKEKVFGTAKKTKDRSNIKSVYCTIKAKDAFSDLIDSIDSKHIIVSFNNMEKRGNHRSHSKISGGEITSILSKRGDLKIFENKFNQFTTGKTTKEDHKEILYVCKTK